MNAIFKIGLLAITASGFLHFCARTNYKPSLNKETNFTANPIQQTIVNTTPNIFGMSLKPIKSMSGDVAGLSEMDISRLMKLKLKIEDKYIVFFGDTMRNPEYEFHAEKSLDFVYTNYNITPDRIGILVDTIQVLTATFPDPLPTVNFLFFNKNIIVQNEGVFFILEKQIENPSLKLPVTGDTVRCLYNENKSCSGFVIQGTRKSGKVIHVVPQNKNVPLEIDGK